MPVQRVPGPVLLGELQRVTGRPRSTLYIMARSGELPVVFRGGRYEMERADLPRVVARLTGDSNGSVK